MEKEKGKNYIFITKEELEKIFKEIPEDANRNGTIQLIKERLF